MNCIQIMVLLFSKEWNLVFATKSNCLVPISLQPEAEFKEFEPRFKFKPRLTYGWFHLKLYQMFQNLSRRLESQRLLHNAVLFFNIKFYL